MAVSTASTATSTCMLGTLTDYDARIVGMATAASGIVGIDARGGGRCA